MNSRLAIPFLILLSLWALPPAGHSAGSEVVINEIMYHPPQDLPELQYVELFNQGGATVDLSGWRFSKGIGFTFPENTKLGPSAYLVLCRDRAAFARHYGKDIPALGDFTGKLSHTGETLALANARGETVDVVRYSTREPWPTGADGYGASLERISPSASGQEAWNWAASALPNLKKPSGTPGRKNDSFSDRLPPIISKVRFNNPSPGEKMSVTAEVTHAEGVKSVALLWQIPPRGTGGEEREMALPRIAGDSQKGTYAGTLDGQPEGTLLRFRLKAVGQDGVARWEPSANEPRPTYTCSTFVNTNTARIPFAYVLNYSRPRPGGRIRPRATTSSFAEPARGESTFVYVPPDGGKVLVFDYVATRPRPDGFKVHFQKDRPFKGMTGINILFGAAPRQILSEPLAFELFRLAGVPAPLTEHLRVWVDGRLSGYQLLIEQPNKTFLVRNQLDDKGNLYKADWRGQGLVGQHEKKTHPTKGHRDLIEFHEELKKKTGTAQWEFIRHNLNVEQWINYFAVSQCLQNWDGFFNNYYLYHDTGGAGQWQIFPWDLDKTWGDYDGVSPRYDWYDMPLSFGMNGDQPPSSGLFDFNGGPHGGPNWWRHPGWFSGPILANPAFRQRFLVRLRELCLHEFTEERMGPLIRDLEQRLEAEVPVRARAQGRDPKLASSAFHGHIQSFRNQVKNRRDFILRQLNGNPVLSREAAGPARFPWAWVTGLAVAAVAVGAGLVLARHRRKKRAPTLITSQDAEPPLILPPPYPSPLTSPAPPPAPALVPPVIGPRP